MGKVKDNLNKAGRKVRKTIKPSFWKLVISTMHPKRYEDLSERRIKKGVGYLVSILFASFLIMAVISIPKIISMPSYIEGELSKFETLNTSMDIKMSEPIILPKEDPQIIIDTETKNRSMGKEKILITKDLLHYRPYGRQKAYNISEYSDLTNKKDELSRTITFLAILLIPSILITAYALFLFKYAVTIIIFTLIIFASIRLAKKDLPFLKSLNTAIYASTPMILLEVIFIPYNSNNLIPMFQFMGLNFYLIPLLIYSVLLSISAFFAAKEKKKGKKGKEYEEIEGIQWDF